MPVSMATKRRIKPAWTMVKFTCSVFTQLPCARKERCLNKFKLKPSHGVSPGWGDPANYRSSDWAPELLKVLCCWAHAELHYSYSQLCFQWEVQTHSGGPGCSCVTQQTEVQLGLVLVELLIFRCFEGTSEKPSKYLEHNPTPPP